MMRAHTRSRMRNGGEWSPLYMFSNGEQGVIYDPNDLSTLFQDAAGTTPVTAAGQPVGLMLDKRLGLVRGGDVKNVTMGATWSTDGDVYTNTGASLGSFLTLASGVPTSSYLVELEVITGPVAIYNSSSGTSLAVLASGARKAIVLSSGSPRIAAENGKSLRVISVRELPGNHAFQPTAASRPMLRQNATTGAYYLETDGSDDWMQTNAIDFTGTDKVSVFTGLRKLSDAAIGIVCELSSSGAASAGTFTLAAPSAVGGVGASFNWRGRGTVDNVFNVGGYPAPISTVLTGSSNISTDESSLRVNGQLAGSAGTDAGAGNFGNYPLYLFRRGGTTSPFNGHFYGLTIVGRLCTDAETRNVERLYANKTGVVLS